MFSLSPKTPLFIYRPVLFFLLFGWDHIVLSSGSTKKGVSVQSIYLIFSFLFAPLISLFPLVRSFALSVFGALYASPQFI